VHWMEGQPDKRKWRKMTSKHPSEVRML
jgi:hypothetical protein